MSEPPTPEPSQPEDPRPDRLGPRPLDRPPADPADAAVFGRPAGVDSAFSPPPGGGLAARTAFADLTVAAPPPEALAAAFGRPTGSTEILQRPPGPSRDDGDSEEVLWTENGADPWRDPGAGAIIGPPAVGRGADSAKAPKRPAGALLSLPEVLFGRRVKPVALVLLGVIALVIGA